MIQRLVGWFVLVPLSIVLALFALANRHPVEVRFDPFPAGTTGLSGIEVPLFGVIYAVLATGILLGGVASWWAQGRHRKAERNLKRETDRMGREIAALKKPDGRGGGDQMLLEDEDLLNKVS